MSALGDASQSKWRRVVLKSRWYDDHFGEGAPRGDVIENRLRLIDESFSSREEEDIASSEVERFHLFQPRR